MSALACGRAQGGTVSAAGKASPSGYPAADLSNRVFLVRLPTRMGLEAVPTLVR